jgi:diguanylate cyclase (GGDEF)-like protein
MAEMEDSAREGDSERGDAGVARAGWKKRLLWTTGTMVCLLAAIFGATQFYAARFWSADVHTVSVRVPLSIAILVGIAVVLVVAGAVIGFVARWRLPARRLREALEGIRAGERPIEELRLPESAGGLGQLIPVIQDLFRELRRQRAQIAALELEMSQRVASRTDALERTLSAFRAQATRDALTGLFNRRLMDQSLDEVVARCVADRAPLCLLMIDVDDFKLLNDTLGHAKGDELLQAVGQLIRSSLRTDDLGFRCGGDEFLIVCPGTTKTQAVAMGRRLTELVDALGKTLPVARKPRLCIGLSVLGEAWGEPSGRALLAEADRRLYAAKAVRKGRAA